MKASLFGIGLLVVAFADESSLMQWNKLDTEETNVRLLDTVLTSDERVRKIAALTHVSESQARAKLSEAVSLLKTVKHEKASAKLQTSSYSQTFVESLVNTPEMNKQIQNLKHAFQAEAPELSRNESSSDKVPSKTLRVADRMLREFESKFFTTSRQHDGADFAIGWGSRTRCHNDEGFAMYFQYTREHSMVDGVYKYLEAEWHQRYGWVFEDGAEVYGQQIFPEHEDEQKSGLWLVLPFNAKPASTAGKCTSKLQKFIVDFYMLIDNIASASQVGGSAYDLSTTAQFTWQWIFDGTTTEPQPSNVYIGAYVDVTQPKEIFSFYFEETIFILQYLVSTSL